MKRFGAIAQLVERMNGIHEATGSTPVSSTISDKKEIMRITVPLLHLIALVKFLVAVTILSSLFLYLAITHPIHQALIGTLLAWSLFVLCLPGAHGASLVGFPAHFLYNKKLITEPYIWTGMALLNIVTLIFFPHYYLLSIPSRLLFSIITHPFPGWIIFITSFVGTFFHFLFDKKSQGATLILIRQLIIILGYLIFLYISHKYAVIILGISIDA